MIRMNGAEWVKMDLHSPGIHTFKLPNGVDITTEENWKVIKQKNVWGVQEKHRNTIAKVKVGDKCLIYVMSTKKDDEIIPPRIVAAYEVVSEVFKDSSRIFKPPAKNKNETYPLRIKLKPIKIFEKPVDFKSPRTKAEIHQKQAEVDRTHSGKGDERDSRKRF